MRLRADLGTATVFLLLALGAARVSLAQTSPQQPSSPQEEKRRKLLEKMGLEKNDQAPAATPAPSTDGNAPAATATPPNGSQGAAGAPAGETRGKTVGNQQSSSSSSSSRSPSFLQVIHPLLVQTCKPCHTVGGAAAATHLLFSGEGGPDHSAVVRMVDVHAPGTSLILAKASGQKMHGGGAPWPAGGIAYDRVLAWIQAGARLDGPGSAATDATAASSPAPAVPRMEASRPTRAAAAATASPAGTTSSAAGSVEVARQAPAAPESVKAVAGDALAAGPPSEAKAIDFATDVHPMLARTCSMCHGPAGPAALTRLVLSRDVHDDYVKVRALVDPAAPARSLLILKATGDAHAGGPVIPISSPGYALMLAWVTAGANEHSTGPVVGGVPSAPSSHAESFAAQPAVSAEGARAPAAGSQAGGGGLDLPLPYGLAIDGRFDLAYERRDFSGNPFANSAVNALRSYHHFLFLSRESTDDPFGLSIEMLSLQFWEAHYRWRAKDLPVQVVIAGGKILVPFGADPLMHQSYGGLSGFDQPILPVIWAEEGVAAHVVAHRRELAMTDDIYVVRGYTLKQADGILNLQSDFSPDDNARLGWGNRLGAAWGPLSAWYSTYFNSLGFGRRLFMQAGDVMLWRLRQIPILGHFSFAAGLLRADVSGGADQGNGGPGKDYYDFGSYFQMRYHPTDWLYLQYREGLRTFNNRRGVFIDDTRLTSDDGSTHNFGVVARTHGLTAGVYYFVNLEKVAEIRNDLLRVSLSYDF